MQGLKNVLGIDIGGTNIKAGFLPGPGPRVLGFKSHPTPKTTRAIWDTLVDIITDYTRHYHVRALGIGCPGPLNQRTGLIINPPNLPFVNLPLKKMLEKETRLKIMLDNDANVFALAEAVWGAGKHKRHIIGLTLGTGVGGGIVIDKQIYHGRGNAGELGYLLQNMNGPVGPFGEHGALQEFIKAEVLFKTAEPSVLAKRHDSKTNQIWQVFGNHLGYALASLTHVLDPDMIILGGQIAKAWPRFITSLKQSLAQNCIFNELPLIKLSRFGDKAGVIGAALLLTSSSHADS